MLSIQRTIEQCITIYNVVLVHKQVLPAHQRWKLVIMYACLSWLSLRCWMWKHYATCIRTIITWLKCGLCKGGTVVTCVVVLTWVWNNKRKVAAERMKGIQLKWELCCTYGRAEINRLDRLDRLNFFRTCLTCENPVPSEWSELVLNLPVPCVILDCTDVWITPQVFQCLHLCCLLHTVSRKLPHLNHSNYFQYWMCLKWAKSPQCLLRTVYSLLQSVDSIQW